ncbi:Postreplication repair E3 ubiquitin-protein ligase RAD18 [Seminavis robusta]|uniref:Postreplication repair E3 ubiquitin-protein ligase RAD18 n=1 Tax=Seminavis robusta TaxID=568900 RepID=A0A9N8F1W2_9STRA|nr:Postreplication repair E3 ubiquitin-protein ligase RAD18 [Seminavis robusta]|eukprot:Sro3451_g348170.1 Postreplication repair E3 ubiquitin-protein ligase RAD18 (617) ;mRNA; r:3217-5067
MSSMFTGGRKADADAAAEVAKDSAQAWVEGPQFSSSNRLHLGMKALEENMRCNICQELFLVPVSLPCSHTFCSTCVHVHFKKCMKSAKRKADCPTCRREVSENDAVANSQLELVLRQYRAIRSDLMQALAFPANSQEGNDVDQADREEDDESKPDRGRGGRKRKTRSEPESDADTKTDGTASGSNAVLQNIDGNQKLKKRAKTNYHGLKKKKLQELCGDEGLPTHGDIAELRARHELFITLYNSECDSIQPRSKRDIANHVSKKEQAEKASKKQASKAHKPMEALIANRVKLGKAKGGWGKTVSSGVKAFDAEMDANFLSLKVKLEQRCPRSKKPSRDWKGDGSIIGASPNPATPSSALNSNKENDSVCSNTEASTLPTNDSNTPPTDPFQLGSNAPSTISHHLSQQSYFVLSQPSAALERIVVNSKSGACDSPHVADAKEPAAVSSKSSDVSSSPLEGSTRPTIETNSQAKATSEPNTMRNSSDKAKQPAGSSRTAAESNADASDETTNARSELNLAKETSNDSGSTSTATNRPPRAPKAATMPKRGPSQKNQTKIPSAAFKRTTKTPAEAPSVSGTRRSARSIVGPWACLACTYINKVRTNSRAKCEICNTERM